MESFFLDIGFTWTWSKMLPYVLFIILGLIVHRYIARRISKGAYKLLALLLIPIPFLIYFLFVPIYQGDFSDNYLGHKDMPGAVEHRRLTAIAIPGCPYCYESITDLVKMKERTGVDTIDFVVLTTDEEHLNWYREKAAGKLNVRASTNSYLKEIAGDQYPAFAYWGQEAIFVWSNESFGVVAKDHIEGLLTGKGEL